MKILVTGGAGFIGSAVVRRLVSVEKCAVVNLDALTYAGRLESLALIAGAPDYAFEHADNAPVVVWPDQSGHGRDLSATQGVRPDGVGLPPQYVARSRINARPAVRFDPASGLAASPGNPIAVR